MKKEGAFLLLPGQGDQWGIPGLLGVEGDGRAFLHTTTLRQYRKKEQASLRLACLFSQLTILDAGVGGEPWASGFY